MDEIKQGEPQYRAFSEAFQTRMVSEEQRIIDFTASTRAVDRYQTRLIGWNINDFMKNPVLLYGHNQQLPPVGRVLSVTIDDSGSMTARAQFAPKEIYDFAGTIFGLVKEGYLGAFSVGFIPHDRQVNPDDNIMELLDNELLEISVVPVPANPEALINAFTRGVIPASYRHLFTRNNKSENSLVGVDMEHLREAVMDWYLSAVGEVREQEPEPAPSADEPVEELALELVQPETEISPEALVDGDAENEMSVEAPQELKFDNEPEVSEEARATEEQPVVDVSQEAFIEDAARIVSYLQVGTSSTGKWDLDIQDYSFGAGTNTGSLTITLNYKESDGTTASDDIAVSDQAPDGSGDAWEEGCSRCMELEAQVADLENIVDGYKTEVQSLTEEIDSIDFEYCQVLEELGIDIESDDYTHDRAIEDIKTNYVRAGAVLSRKNKADLQMAVECIGRVLDSGTMKPDDTTEDGVDSTDQPAGGDMEDHTDEPMPHMKSADVLRGLQRIEARVNELIEKRDETSRVRAGREIMSQPRTIPTHYFDELFERANRLAGEPEHDDE